MVLIYIITAIFGTTVLAGFIIFKRKNPLRWLISHRPFTHPQDCYRQERFLCRQSKKCLGYLYKEAKFLASSPELAENIFYRLKSLLPSDGILREQRSRLHCLFYSIHKKYCIRMEEAGSVIYSDTKNQKGIYTYFEQLSRIRTCMEHLNQQAVEQEKRIYFLLQLGQKYTAGPYFKNLCSCIQVAKGFARFDGKLLKAIHKTEKKLLKIAEKTGISVNTETQKQHISAIPKQQ